MPLQKPRGRKRPSHKMTYASLTILVLVGIAGLAYAYLNGYLSTGGANSSSSSIVTTSNCPTPPAASNDTFACFKTTEGSFEVELFTQATPRTVANFVHLTQAGFYNNLVWHRIVPGFVIQTGDNNTFGAVDSTRSIWGQGGSKVSVPFEYVPSLHNYEGYLGMASTAAGAGGTSQFYINLVDNSASLDQKYAVFGKVINGMQVVNAIAAVQTYCETGQNVPAGCQSGGYPEQPVVASQAMLQSVQILGS